MEKDNRSNVGQSIRAMRNRADLTQKELGNLSGMSEPAVRCYELGIRKPKPNQLEAMARAMKVRPEAFDTYNVTTPLEFIHALFACEDSMRLTPDERGLSYLTSDNREIAQALRDWGLMRKKLEDGEITADEYEDWKARYNPSVFMGDSMEEEPDPYTGEFNSKMRP
ncbi:helix-turn-helix domain-containing protein [Paratractidigestivibacter sp.]|uniref:helix-turn-helix domain-containing protein n=1 Tax=Paratractidigestivibacter sp. TaxID=2847316 RepID=UPI002AC8D129|nr:helix-turn-helix domain-containing protein [Paratractidigestivibacter sp.]